VNSDQAERIEAQQETLKEVGGNEKMGGKLREIKRSL